MLELQKVHRATVVAGNLQDSESEDNEPFQRAPRVRLVFLGYSLLVPRCCLGDGISGQGASTYVYNKALSAV